MLGEIVGATRRSSRLLPAAAVIVWAVSLLIVLSMLIYRWPDVIFTKDFVSFWTGAALVRDGAGPSLFDMEMQREFQVKLRAELAKSEELRRETVHDPFHNPPPLALIFVPLTLMPMPWAYAVWWGLSLLAFVAAIAVPLWRRPNAPATTALLLTYLGVLTSLLEGQVNGLFLLVLSLGLLALASGRPILGGALLGVLWLKPQYAVLLGLVLLVKRRWWELSGMLATSAVLAALSGAMVGLEGLARYLEVLRQIGEFHPPPSSLISPEKMVNWRSLLLNLFPGITESAGSPLVLVLGAATAVGSLLAWRGPWEPASPRFARQMLVVMLATIVASPHSHFHGTVLLLAPLALTLARPMEGAPMHSLWLLGIVVGYLLSSLAWAMRDLSWLLAPYFLIAMGMLILHCRVCSSPSGSPVPSKMSPDTSLRSEGD